jgi:hypothetical protein
MMGFLKRLHDSNGPAPVPLEEEVGLNWNEQDEQHQKPVVFIPENLYIAYGRSLIPVH